MEQKFTNTCSRKRSIPRQCNGLYSYCRSSDASPIKSEFFNNSYASQGEHQHHYYSENRNQQKICNRILQTVTTLSKEMSILTSCNLADLFMINRSINDYTTCSCFSNSPFKIYKDPQDYNKCQMMIKANKSVSHANSIGGLFHAQAPIMGIILLILALILNGTFNLMIIVDCHNQNGDRTTQMANSFMHSNNHHQRHHDDKTTMITTASTTFVMNDSIPLMRSQPLKNFKSRSLPALATTPAESIKPPGNNKQHDLNIFTKSKQALSPNNNSIVDSMVSSAASKSSILSDHITTSNSSGRSKSLASKINHGHKMDTVIVDDTTDQQASYFRNSHKQKITFKVNGKEFSLKPPPNSLLFSEVANNDGADQSTGKMSSQSGDSNDKSKPAMVKSTLESRIGDSFNQDYDSNDNSDTDFQIGNNNNDSNNYNSYTNGNQNFGGSTTSINNRGSSVSTNRYQHSSTTASPHQDEDTLPSASASSSIMMNDWPKTSSINKITSAPPNQKQQQRQTKPNQQVSSNVEQQTSDNDSVYSTSTQPTTTIASQQTKTSSSFNGSTRQITYNNSVHSSGQYPKSHLFSKARYSLNVDTNGKNKQKRDEAKQPSKATSQITGENNINTRNNNNNNYYYEQKSNSTSSVKSSTIPNNGISNNIQWSTSQSIPSSSSIVDIATITTTVASKTTPSTKTPIQYSQRDYATSSMMTESGDWPPIISKVTVAPIVSSNKFIGSNNQQSSYSNNGLDAHLNGNTFLKDENKFNDSTQFQHQQELRAAPFQKSPPFAVDDMDDLMRNNLVKSPLVQRDLTHKLMAGDLHLRSSPHFTHSSYPSNTLSTMSSDSTDSQTNISAPINRTATKTAANIDAVPQSIRNIFFGNERQQPANTVERFNSIVRTGPVYPQPSFLTGSAYRNQMNQANPAFMLAAQAQAAQIAALAQQSIGKNGGVQIMTPDNLGQQIRAQSRNPQSSGSHENQNSASLLQQSLNMYPFSHAPSRSILTSMTSPHSALSTNNQVLDQMLASANQLGVSHASPGGGAIQINGANSGANLNQGAPHHTMGGANQRESAVFSPLSMNSNDYHEKLADLVGARNQGSADTSVNSNNLAQSSNQMGSGAQASSASTIIVEDQSATYSDPTQGANANSYDQSMNNLNSAISTNSVGPSGQNEVQTSTSRSSNGDMYARGEHKSVKQPHMSFSRDPYEDVANIASTSGVNGEFERELTSEIEDDFTGRPPILSAYRRPSPLSSSSMMSDSYLPLTAAERFEGPRRYYGRRPFSYSDYLAGEYLSPATSAMSNVAALPRTYPRSSSATWLSTSGAPSAYTDPTSSSDPWLDQATNGYEISPLASMLAATHHYPSAYRLRPRYHRISPYAASYLTAASSTHDHHIHPSLNFVPSYTTPVATEAIGYAISPLAAAAATAANTLAAIDKSRTQHHGWFTFPRFTSAPSTPSTSVSTPSHSATASSHTAPVTAHAIPAAAFYHRPASYALSSVPFFALAPRPAASTQFAAASTNTPTIIPYFHPGAAPTLYAYRPSAGLSGGAPILTAASYAYPIRIPLAATIPRTAHFGFAPATNAIRTIGVRPIFTDLQISESKSKFNLSSNESQQNTGKNNGQYTLSAMAKNLTRKMFGSASQLKPVHIAPNPGASPSSGSGDLSQEESALSPIIASKIQPKSSTPLLPFSTMSNQFGIPESPINQRYQNLFNSKHLTFTPSAPKGLLLDNDNNFNLATAAPASQKRMPPMTQQQIEALNLQAALLQRRSSDQIYSNSQSDLTKPNSIPIAALKNTIHPSSTPVIKTVDNMVLKSSNKQPS